MNTFSLSDFTSIERQCAQRGMVLAGADEAGRGPLAGPVVAAAVIMPAIIEGIDDSKKLSEKKREKLYDNIIVNAEAWAVGIIDQHRIDEINILNAAREAFRQAVAGLSKAPDIVFHDEITGLALPVRAMSVIKGDAKVYSIAAASIIAKVTRDRMMREFDVLYPEYGFAKHKGYGTKAHMEAIREYGPCELHRLTFLKKPGLAQPKPGERGEDTACRMMRSRGMEILARNYRIPGGEIDIIARDGDCIVFAEVKERASGRYGFGAEAVGETKISAVCRAARRYLYENDLNDASVRFDVIDIMAGQISYIKNAFEEV